MPTSPSFPENFTWGAASSSYQIEGGASIDGKGESVWDVFCKKPGAIFDNHTGETACDHVARMADDVKLMAQIGLQAYRFSISWPRVLPAGRGAVNAPGLAFYDRLVDRLLDAGITPWLTLFHWDFPQALQSQGGWLNRESPRWFADYAGVVVDALSDRVTNWMTINEPQVFIELGHSTGTHAPGLKLSPREVLEAGHHALMAHGLGVQVIRSRAKKKPNVGWAPVGHVTSPATDRITDVEAAYRQMFSIVNKDSWNNTWWADPVCLGRYPEDGLQLHGSNAPRVHPGDMETIHQPLDFYGVNIYQGGMVRAGKDGKPQWLPKPPGAPMTTFRWHVTPECLYWGPRFLHERYKLPIIITENGMANTDWVMADGRVHDLQRIDFLRSYLLELGRGAKEADVRGYFLWSILDNFEWAEGYRERFGIIHVDYATQERTPKDSAYWYRDVIATNGDHLASVVDQVAPQRD